MTSNGQNVRLNRSLFITRDNGIGTDPNSNKNINITLDDQQSGSAVTFPIFAGTEGVVVETGTYSPEVTVQYYRPESLEYIRVRFKKDIFGNFHN